MKWRFIIFIILFLIVGKISFAEVSDDATLLEQIKSKEAEIKKLELELNNYRYALLKTQSQTSTLKGQITLIESQINKLKTDLKITQAKISKTESNIKLYSRKIKEKEQKIKERQMAMARSFRFLAYADNRGFLAAILQSEKFSDFLNQSEYLASIANGLYSDYKILAQDKMEITNLLSGQKELKKDLIDFKNELQSKSRLIENQKQEKNALLKETKNQEAEYQKIISQIQIKQAQIQKEILELENKLRGEVTGVPPVRPGELAWPLLGRLTQGYGPTFVTGFYNDAYKFHNGIDIALEYGAPIRASLDGTVVASGDNGRYAYGKWLAIRHNNGLTTLYAHFSAKTVSALENVSQGQLIGYEGSSGFVTGPHLHFTVYSTNTFRTEKRWFGLLPLGGSVNPLDYLLQ
ncbi:MAG: peptidoglycan DD-metalloendopeptidase family protein [Parcubacteria group bacterium]|nr:peptidoglycan DD-metalloendopeptidase family protein [Parcubacteria group bacterium]